MKCIIIEDQPPAQRVLVKYINDYGLLDLQEIFNNAIQAIEYLSKNEVDLIFLDIHLPKLSGMDFLKSLDNPPHVILTTAFPDFALESYDHNVVDYLLKPFSFSRFIKAVTKINRNTTIASNMMENETPSVYIKSGHEFHKVDITDIIYINSDRDYTEIHTSDKKHLSPESLKHWEDQFSGFKFIRIHKSFLINEKEIIKIKSSEVVMSNDKTLPVGRAYKDNITGLINL